MEIKCQSCHAEYEVESIPPNTPVFCPECNNEIKIKTNKLTPAIVLALDSKAKAQKTSARALKAFGIFVMFIFTFAVFMFAVEAIGGITSYRTNEAILLEQLIRTVSAWFSALIYIVLIFGILIYHEIKNKSK